MSSFHKQALTNKIQYVWFKVETQRWWGRSLQAEVGGAAEVPYCGNTRLVKDTDFNLDWAQPRPVYLRILVTTTSWDLSIYLGETSKPIQGRMLDHLNQCPWVYWATIYQFPASKYHQEFLPLENPGPISPQYETDDCFSHLTCVGLHPFSEQTDRNRIYCTHMLSDY